MSPIPIILIPTPQFPLPHQWLPLSLNSKTMDQLTEQKPLLSQSQIYLPADAYIFRELPVPPSPPPPPWHPPAGTCAPSRMVCVCLHSSPNISSPWCTWWHTGVSHCCNNRGALTGTIGAAPDHCIDTFPYNTCKGIVCRARICKRFQEPRNRLQEIASANPCSMAGRYVK
jgi:hypothetical protein